MKTKSSRIYKNFIDKKINKDSATEKLIYILEESNNHDERYETIEILGKLNLTDKKVFEFLENLLISDDNLKIRKKVVEIIRDSKFKNTLQPLIWSLNHEPSPEVLEIVHETIIKIIKTYEKDSKKENRNLLNQIIDNIKKKDFRIAIETLQENCIYATMKNQQLIEILINYFTITYLEKVYWRVKYQINNLRVVKLDFIFKGLTTIPSPLKYLTSLESLILRYNQISKVPEWIGDLSNLKILNLNVNEINQLPNSLGNLNNLIELNLWKNNLTLIPTSIGSLKSLKSLNLRLNFIKALPSTIGQLDSLKDLNLHDNKISLLPAEIGSFKSLERLNLSWNELEKLPNSIGLLKNLKTLDIGRNK